MSSNGAQLQQGLTRLSDKLSHNKLHIYISFQACSTETAGEVLFQRSHITKLTT